MLDTKIALPCDVATELLRHLNGDEGWRAQVATKLMNADERAKSVPERRRADDLRKTVIALGALSGALVASREQCTPPSKEKTHVLR